MSYVLYGQFDEKVLHQNVAWLWSPKWGLKLSRNLLRTLKLIAENKNRTNNPKCSFRQHRKITANLVQPLHIHFQIDFAWGFTASQQHQSWLKVNNSSYFNVQGCIIGCYPLVCQKISHIIYKIYGKIDKEYFGETFDLFATQILNAWQINIKANIYHGGKKYNLTYIENTILFIWTCDVTSLKQNCITSISIKTRERRKKLIRKCQGFDQVWGNQINSDAINIKLPMIR